MLPVRHAALRLQGLKGKVLVVDEVHAFDPYMRRELVELLRFHAALGGCVILLSATLAKTHRAALVDAFRDGLGSRRAELLEEAYPLATLASAAAVVETPCPIRDGLARRVTVTRLPDFDAALGRILDAARAGAAVAWVRNTVDDAIAAAAAVRAAGLEPLLFHARFAMADRLAIEAEVLRRFGRRSAGRCRNGVLIATQVIEQSLDLDFDLLCSDLAPVDLLIQRAGRLWRHEREPRPVPGPELLVVSPEPVPDPGPGWIRDLLPGTAAVYGDPGPAVAQRPRRVRGRRDHNAGRHARPDRDGGGHCGGRCGPPRLGRPGGAAGGQGPGRPRAGADERAQPEGGLHPRPRVVGAGHAHPYPAGGQAPGRAALGGGPGRRGCAVCG